MNVNIWKTIAAVFVVSMLVTFGATTPVRVRAIAPVVVGAIIVSGVIGGIIGYIIGQAQVRTAVLTQYKSDVNIYTTELMKVYSNAWYNIFVQMDESHELFFNRTYNYYARWAESIASNVCKNKTELTDEDLKPILNDLALVLKNYVSVLLDATYDIYVKGVALAGMRHNAGIDTAIDAFHDGWIKRISYDGKISCEPAYCGYVYPKNITVYVNSDVIGYIDIKSRTKFVNESKIMDVVLSASTYSVYVRYEGEGDREFMEFREFLTNPEFTVPEKIRQYFVDVKMMYTNAKINGNMMCFMVNVTGAPEIPPPSISLPFDYNTLNKMDPLSRMQLYQTYLYYLSQLDWSKVNQLTAQSINGMPNATAKVCGQIDLDGCLIPWNIIFPMTFVLNGMAGIGGQWYFVDPVNGTIRIVTIPVYTPSSINVTYTIVRNITDHQFLVQLEDGRQFVGVDVDGDGKIDYFVPLMYITGLKDVRYDPVSGQYREFDANELKIGPQQVQEWTQKRLADVGGLERVNGGNPFQALTEWFGSLDTKMKIVVIAAGALVVILLVMAASRGNVVVVNSRR